MLEGPWARANKVQFYGGSQEEGATLDRPIVGNSHNRLGLGKLPETVRETVQELELRVRVSTGYYLYTSKVNLVLRFEPC